MYVSYLLDKDTSMYPGSARCTSNNLPVQNFVSAPAYPEYMGYHPVPGLDGHGQAAPAWGSHYGPQREDWSAYGPGPSGAGPAAHINGSSPGQGSYSSADYSSLHPAAAAAAAAAALPPGETINAQQISPSSQRHSSYEWMRKTVQSTSTGKTRTREKYRVVYTDHQRLELEKEFHYNRYITIRRKSELAANLRLSERQVKIWFQNRRAKERKLMKKKMTHFEGSSLGSLQSDSGSVSPMPVPEAQTHPELPGALFAAPPAAAAVPMGGLQHGGSLQQVVASQ
ncbi:homeobox protein CDX-4-like [Prinia subflava]|uniref:homeobox protein CDX-4-like n=1 Tax=Prinia subflava TaxID=208062 RepID=UPI002FDFE579